MTMDRQRANVATACRSLAPVAVAHELVISHGNGPQVGLLALQASSFDEVSEYPFDVLGAQTEGMIGYLIEQELGNLLPFEKPLATLLSMTEVDPDDPAFRTPTKYVGPVYSQTDAERLATERGWTVRRDGEAWRRVVPSPLPVRIFQTRPVEWLLAQGCVVICAGGGGIPTMYEPGTRRLVGVEAVIDKDRASAVLARGLGADLLVIATDVDGVYLDWGTPDQTLVAEADPDTLDALGFAAGSMGPKVEAASAFARETGKPAVIGSLDQLTQILDGKAGTRIDVHASGIVPRATG
jgi:carbamate kinase